MPRHARKANGSHALSRGWRSSCWGVLVVALLLTVGVSGCGAASGTAHRSSSEVVVRVGHATIDRAEVEHWASAVHRSDSVARTPGQTGGTPRDRALAFLISSNWVMGEAAERGISISTAAVARGLREKIASMPGGHAEFAEELSFSGQTLADVKFEVEAELAAAMLRAVAKRVPAVTAAQVASYYASHRRNFYVPNQRVAYLVEGIDNYPYALALAREAGSGARLSQAWFRELVPETPEVTDSTTLAHMIFTATPGRVAGPKMIFGHWVLALVKRLIPAGIQPLAAIRAKLSKTLGVERGERALKRFAAAYVRKWTARTSCAPGYVVQKCSGYHGRLSAERNPLTGE